MKKYVFGFIFGILMSSGIVYAATLIDSKDVTYTPSDSSFNVNDVSDALNNLYNRISDLESSSSAVYYLGTATSYDIKTLFPQIDYTALTSDNFLIVASGTCTNTYRNSFNFAFVEETVIGPSASYDATTGILTVTNTYGQGRVNDGNSGKCSLNDKVYFITKNVINKSN